MPNIHKSFCNNETLQRDIIITSLYTKKHEDHNFILEIAANKTFYFCQNKKEEVIFVILQW